MPDSLTVNALTRASVPLVPIVQPKSEASSSNNTNVSSSSTEQNEDSTTQLNNFKDLLQRTNVLGQACAALAWDRVTYMPKLALDTRAMQQGVLSKMSHEIFTSTEMVRLLEHLEQKEVYERLSELDRITVKETRKGYNIAVKLPSDFVEEYSNLTTKAATIWEEAKDKSDFNLFAPYLEKIVELKRKEAAYTGYKGSPYNALLNDFEEEMTVEKLDKIFEELKSEARSHRQHF